MPRVPWKITIDFDDDRVRETLSSDSESLAGAVEDALRAAGLLTEESGGYQITATR